MLETTLAPPRSENKQAALPQIHRWTRSQYDAMAEAGLFRGEHVELIEGQVIDMSPKGSPHSTSVTLTGDMLRAVFGAGWFVRIQDPLGLGESSEPEPDIAVIVGKVRDYKDAHPTTAALIVEVAETSLAYDRTVKASLYAKAGIADYWIANLGDRQLEVHRNPVADPAQVYGFGYAEASVLSATDFVTPLANPQARIAVADLLP